MSTLALQGANEQLRKLSERLIAVEQEERRAIALDLHDDVGQALVSAAIGLHRLEDLAGAEYQELLRQCSRIVGESVDKLRALAGELRPVELDNGLQPALEALVANARATTGATIELKLCRIENARPYRAVELVCYRVIQEALNNAIRHARASEIAVRVECDERLIKLNVRDNGAGFAASGPQRSGVGLGGMSERARLVGGQLKVLSVPGSGTSVTGIFPLGPPQSP
jgi:signal transduction histidine kinase